MQVTCIGKFLALFLSLWVFAIGSGVAEHFHDLSHDWEDAREDAIAKSKGLPTPEHPIHDESNCPLHASLHAPVISVGFVPTLIALGLLVAFLTQIAPRPVGRRVIHSIDCRGPPAVAI